MGLRTKTFFVMLLVGGGIAALALLTQQQTVRSNFRAYLQAAQQLQAEQLASELAQSYADAGDDWAPVLRQAWRWPEMVPPLRRAAARDARPPPHRRRLLSRDAPPPPRERAPPPPRRENRPPDAPRIDDAVASDAPTFSQIRQFALYDAERQLLSQTGIDGKHPPHWLAIRAFGQTIGWLSWASPQVETHPLDAQFWAEQQQNILVIGASALLLAALSAWLFSGLLLGRIRRLSTAVAHVAEGQYGAAVKDPSSDELGMLASDINTMSQRLLQARDREQQWLADIAHELRTPLAVLRGELEALQDGIRPSTPEAICSLQDEVAHLSRLIDDLHLLSSSESGQLTLHLADNDLTELIRNICRGHQPELHNRQLDLQLDLPASLVACVDAHRIRQVLDNLLVNLCRYASPGAAQVLAREEGHNIVIRVADSGPGLSASERQQLFDRLYRTDTARSREHGGSGLGLAICRGIVQAHGGHICAEASPRGGLEITICLPREAKASR